MSGSLAGAKAIVLSGHGTVFDSAGAVRFAADALGEATGPLAALWEAKRFEYAWMSQLTGRRTDLWELTGEALDHAMSALGLPANPLLRARLMQGMLQAPPFPDVRPALVALREARGRPLALLSNASVSMLVAAAKAGGLYALFDALLSAEPTGSFKPAPAVYALAPARFGLAPADILYVSAHPWDVAGAASAGLTAVWLDRARRGRGEFAWAPPAAVIASLADLPALVSDTARAA
ncbi:haloacid dehalogenase type II [Elioraea thermophila]|uniref:haloacid dehalogenase type II n=1 Tax=Elioraea thermophila TaxID=2185104 RepID=UPI000DF2BAEA|nr:haloacid dehalogenase type II [Elioraea thermophila]